MEVIKKIQTILLLLFEYKRLIIVVIYVLASIISFYSIMKAIYYRTNIDNKTGNRK